ncbi:acyl-CoA dehydrogenase family protein [Nocardia sp. NPDC052566]|uniref:acyl-CoA dehydrogenase family protein n=1 Tax=Nocardia sp. NPDC052566 TaxID=3364330 RepID=UPI0037CC9E54
MIRWTREQRELRGALLGMEQALNGEDKWKAVRELGISGLPFDDRFGGLGRDLPTTMYVLEGLGYVCRDAGLSFSVTTHLVSTGVPLHFFGSPELQERFLPAVCAGDRIGAHAISEPEAGSDMLAMRTTAKEDGDHLILNGSKAFVSNGPIADLFVVYAKTDPNAGPFGLTAMVVERDTPGLTVGNPIPKVGLTSSPLAELFFDDCRVPLDNVIGTVGAGFAVFDHVMKWEIVCSFIVNVGEMQRRLESAVDYAKRRKQFGQPIGAFQAVAHRIVDMRIAVDTARRALYDAALRLDAGEDCTVDIAIAKIVASEGNLNSAIAAVRTFGGYGVMTEYGIEEGVRDALAGTIYSGTSDIQRNRIAAEMGL